MRRVVIVGNVIDDTTRLHRGISTDSPAASKKVFDLCHALRLVGVETVILSMGRGRVAGSGHLHRAKVVRCKHAAILYADFLDVRWISEVITTISLLGLFLRMRSREETVVIYYNRHPGYLGVLLAASFRRFVNVLDLEDGEVGGGGKLRLSSAPLRIIFDALCSGGALLACSALIEMTSCRPCLCYYGAVAEQPVRKRFDAERVHIILGGTVDLQTGVDQFAGCVDALRCTDAHTAGQVRFDVTGQGGGLDTIRELASDYRQPEIVIHSRLSQAAYEGVLRTIDVGLALKPDTGPLARSTFPSKVVEFAAAGILVITTDISDVEIVLGDCALYLPDTKPESLARWITWICRNRAAARERAERGAERIRTMFSVETQGKRLAEFLFGKSKGVTVRNGGFYERSA